MTKRVEVITWADGYGDWHARVSGASTPSNAKLHASRAIRSEMELRGNGSVLGNLKLVVDTLNHIPGSITYKEAY